MSDGAAPCVGSVTADCNACVYVWLQPNDDIGSFFSTTEPFYPASYYFNYGQPGRATGTSSSPEDGQPAWTERPRGRQINGAVCII